MLTTRVVRRRVVIQVPVLGVRAGVIGPPFWCDIEQKKVFSFVGTMMYK